MLLTQPRLPDTFFVRGWASLLCVLLAQSCCMQLPSDGIEACRRACGGHGYLDASGLPQMLGASAMGSRFTEPRTPPPLEEVPSCKNVTVEGENFMIAQQTTKGLLQPALQACVLRVAFHVASWKLNHPHSLWRSVDPCCSYPSFRCQGMRDVLMRRTPCCYYQRATEKTTTASSDYACFNFCVRYSSHPIMFVLLQEARLFRSAVDVAFQCVGRPGTDLPARLQCMAVLCYCVLQL